MLLNKERLTIGIGIQAFIAGLLIIISGCVHLRPIDIPDETALEPAKTELWTALVDERLPSTISFS